MQRGDRLDGVRAADGPHPGFGQAEVRHLALGDQLLHGACDVLDRDVGVDAVLVEQVDAVGVEPLEGVLDAVPDRLGSTSSPTIVSLSGKGGKLELIPMQPSPIADTVRSAPSARCSTVLFSCLVEVPAWGVVMAG